MTRDEERAILIAKFDRDVAKRSRIMRLLLATDQWFSVLLWNSSQDETISSHVGRRIKDGKANWFDYKLCSVLKWIQSEHCKRSEGE